MWHFLVKCHVVGVGSLLSIGYYIIHVVFCSWMWFSGTARALWSAGVFVCYSANMAPKLGWSVSIALRVGQVAEHVLHRHTTTEDRPIVFF